MSNYLVRGVKDSFNKTRKYKTVYNDFNIAGVTNTGTSLDTPPRNQILSFTEHLQAGNSPVNQIEGRTLIARQLNLNIGLYMNPESVTSDESGITARAIIFQWKSRGAPDIADLWQIVDQSDTAISHINCTSEDNINVLWDSKVINLDIYNYTTYTNSVSIFAEDLEIMSLGAAGPNPTMNGLFLLLLSSSAETDVCPLAKGCMELNYYDT